MTPRSDAPMPTYQYQSLSSDGQSRTGVLAAQNRSEVVRQLLDRGETATRVEAVAELGNSDRLSSATGRRATPQAAPHSGADHLRRRFAALTGQGRPTIPRTVMATFIREIATALEAGLPLMQSLRTVRRQAHGKGMISMLDYLIERVEAGDPIHVAARDYGPPFDDMIVGMLRASDASGDMSGLLHQLADLLDRSVELRRDVLSATYYPLIVLALLLGSVVLLVTVLVPRLIEPMVSEQNFELPLPTQILLGAASFMQSWWLMILLCIIGGYIGWTLWSNVPHNRLRFHRFLLRIPALGRLLRDVAVARFTRTLGTLVASGLPILDALRITRNTLGNVALMAAIDDVMEQVTAGKPLADPLERSGLFPPLLVQVVNLGERSGRLDSMLLHAAGAFDRQVTLSIGLFTKALPPVLLVFMALIGGFVLLAILLPMLQLQNMVQ